MEVIVSGETSPDAVDLPAIAQAEIAETTATAAVEIAQIDADRAVAIAQIEADTHIAAVELMAVDDDEEEIAWQEIRDEMASLTAAVLEMGRAIAAMSDRLPPIQTPSLEAPPPTEPAAINPETLPSEAEDGRRESHVPAAAAPNRAARRWL